MSLKLALDSLGKVTGTYRFAAGLGWENANLFGEFHADQSYLDGWAQQLRQVQRCIG